MSKPIGIFFCVLIFLAGCATNPKTSDEIISSPVVSPANVALNWEESNAIHPMPRSPVKPAMPVTKINSPPPVVVSPAQVKSVMTWSPVNEWAAQHEIGAPHFLSATPVTTYAVSSTNGVMILTLGSHQAAWNGIEINLGFPPELIDNKVFLHTLDLQKNLEPLLSAPPLAFGADRVIVIDPGHGGNNTGTHSVRDGHFEKEFTLDWAKRLKPLLEAEGWRVFLTRTNDADVSLSNRVAFAETHHANVFISLHFNSAAPDTKQAGLETYCLTPAGMPSTLTRGYDDPWSENLPGNFFDAQNLQLAVKLQSALLRATGETDRGVRRARFITVLRGQSCPAILIEGGYLSNPLEAKRIEDPEFRQQLAAAAAAALK